MNNKNMKTIMHSHWDREWYFTVEETQMYLRYLMQNVFSYLSENKDVRYLLDGQSVMLDDLAKYYEKMDENKNILREQVDLGPWYTQSDLTLPSGESIYRNLYYGLETAKKYTDNPLLVGYAPDTFGHNPQMPQIYRGFGIDSTVFWRGYSKQMAKSNAFDWVGIDGSEVKAISLPAGYQGAKYLPTEKEELKERIDTIVEKYSRFGSEDKVLLMNGHDQMPIQKDIKEILDDVREMFPEYEVELSDLRSYVDQYVGKEGEKVEGYLDHGDFTRVHRTIGSTRMDIKMLNREVEKSIYEILEPLSLIGQRYNLDYPELLVDKSLKELMGSHAHDSLGGCNTDEVNADIKNRINSIKRLVNNHAHITMRSIADSQTEDYDVFVYNLKPYKLENELVEVEVQVKDLDFVLEDSKGNKVEFDIVEHKDVNMQDIDRQVLAKMLDIHRIHAKLLIKVPSINGLDIEHLKIVTGENSSMGEVNKFNNIEDDYYKISINDKSIDLDIKGKDASITNFISIENSGDDGDSYDYSPPVNDWVIGENGIDSVEVLEVKHHNLFKSMILKLSHELPYNLVDRENHKTEIHQEYIVEIILKNDGKIGLSVDFTNKSIDQRTRFKVRSLSDIESINAGCQFGFVDIKNNKELEKLSVDEKWVEKAVDIYNFQDKLIHDGNLSIEAHQLNEFEYLGDNIYLTLMRSYSYMGKENLVNRPNRASGMNLFTPEARLIDENFSYQIELDYINPDKKINGTSLIAYQNKEFNRFNINLNKVEAKEYFLDLPVQSLNISALKKAQNEDGIIIRMFNPNDDCTIDFTESVAIYDFFENEIEKSNQVTVRKNQIINIKI